MTRWARSGNTQKHQKMPEDPSTWEELSKDIKKIKNAKIVKSEISSNVEEVRRDVALSKINKTNKKPRKSKKKQQNRIQDSQQNIDKNDICEKLNVIENSKNMIGESVIKKDSDEIDKSFIVDQLNKEKNKQIVVENSAHDDQINKSANKKTSSKKEFFRIKTLQKRLKNGITLLTPKAERKLYQIKKRLREKGYPGEQIKDIIRKERRKAELEFRKSNFNKTCFNCRERGHVLSDCPLPMNGSNQPIGVCFKCGSLEHTSSKCGKKVSGYPFATCFICKTEGHISRDCPTNKHGVYPKGGRCNLCDNVNHLRKDCPSIKKKEEELSVTLHTINEGKSIDEEIIDNEKSIVQKKVKKMKIVKF